MDYSDYNNLELNEFRKLQNSKLQIHQLNNEPIYRDLKLNKKLKPFHESFENEKIKTDSIKILESSSNMLIYSMANNRSLQNSNLQIKKMIKNSKGENEEKDEILNKKYKKFVKKIKLKNIKNEPEYIKLCEFLDHPRIHETMRGNYHAMVSILRHKYLKYHPKGKEIYETYKGFLVKDENLNLSEESDDDEIIFSDN